MSEQNVVGAQTIAEVEKLMADRYVLAESFEKHWRALVPGIEPPKLGQIYTWVVSNSPDALVYALGELARKNCAMKGQMDAIHAAKFFACCLRSYRERNKGAVQPKLPAQVFADVECVA
jgi:hypothetical protein